MNEPHHHHTHTHTGMTMNAASGDPTRTLLLRRSFEADLYRRFRALKGKINNAIITLDVFGLKDTPTSISFNAEIGPRYFAYATTAEKIELFMEWLQDMVERGILATSVIPGGRTQANERWTDTYIRRAYTKGIDRGRTELEKAGYVVQDMPFLQGTFVPPIHVDTVAALFTRTFSELKGITAAMDQAISRELAEGFTLGLNPREIARRLNERVDAIGIRRARLLARTEVIRAHHMANMMEYEAAGIDGVTILAEWSTAGDGRVCEICMPLEGRIFTLDEVKPMIPRHPNCRCVALPVPADELNEQ